MKRFIVHTIFVFCLALGLFTQAQGRIFFAAPNGLPTNSGDQASPWDLQTALTMKPVIMPGDTIYLRGGVYRGVFNSTLTGAAGLPITVRSAPGEWAIIDANQAIALASSIGTGGGTITFSPGANMPDPVVVMIDGECLQLVRRIGDTYTINARGWNGTLPSSHAAGAMVRVMEPTLTIRGSDVIFGNFEIIDSKIERVLLTPGSNPIDIHHRYAGINMLAPRSKVINTIIHETYDGIGFWSQAVDSELYGNIIFNNGEEAPDRGHGHGIYTQNDTGQKIISDNITFGNFGGFGIKVYGSSASTLRGYTLAGNINFLNALIVGGNAPADDIKLFNNFLYGSGFALGFGNPDNGAVTIQDNYVYAGMPVDLKWWKQVTMVGNRFYQNGDTQGLDTAITQPVGLNALPQYRIDNNSYIFGRAYQAIPFYVNPGPLSPNTYYNFDQWRALGFDINSTWQGATTSATDPVRPRGVDIFYRPNKYETGRAHVVVYNYDAVPSVTLDLSKTGLVPGQGFEIRNGQNYAGPPIAGGSYSSQFITISLAGLTVAQPWGHTNMRNAELNPYFCVFVIVPTTSTTATPPPPSGSEPLPSPSPTPTPTPTKIRGKKNN